MQEYISFFVHDTIALLTILNPLAAVGIMMSLISDSATDAVVKKIAYKTTLTIIIASLVTLFTGELLFKFFGINVMSIKVSGGILLMIIALNMASGHSSKTRHTQEEHQEAQESEDISIVPLGIPILFGPGVIATIIILNNNLEKILSPINTYALLSGVILFSALVTFIVLRKSIALYRLLGITGMKVLTRIMGLIVGAIAAQFIISGVKGLWG